MADENEVKIVIKAVNDASGILKQIAKDTASIAESTKKMAAGTKAATSATKEQIDALKISTKTQLDNEKIQKAIAVTETQRARTASVLTSTQNKALLDQQRIATEANRTNQAYWRERLQTAQQVIKTTEASALADARVAAQNIRNNILQAKGEAEIAAANERAANLRIKNEQLVQKEKERTTKITEDQIKTEKQLALQTTPAIQGMIDGVKAYGEQIAVATGILVAFSATVKKAYEFGREGAQLERLEASGTALAKSFGLDLAEAVRKIKDASLDTVSTQTAILQTNRALLLGVAADADTLAKLMEVAALRGRAVGLDTTVAFDRIILGIGRLSTRILDDIGIVVDGETAYKLYGEAIGKTADQLTEAEKRIALTNAIVKEGNQLLLATGGVTEDNAAHFEQLNAHWTDFVNNIKTSLSGPVGNVILALDRLLFGQQEINEALVNHADDVVKSGVAYDEYAAELTRAAEAAGMMVDAQGNLIRATAGAGGRGMGGIRSMVIENYLLSESQYAVEQSLLAVERAGAAENEELLEHIARAEAARKRNEEFAKALKEASDELRRMQGLAEDLSFEDAANEALRFAESLGVMRDDQLQKLKLELGLVDAATLQFRESLIAAGADGKIALEELQEAFLPIATLQIGKLADQLQKDMDELIQKTRDALADIHGDFIADELEDSIKLGQKVEDIETDRLRDLEDLENESRDKREKLAGDHNKKLEDIEKDHQREIDKILRKFEMARMRALIDLDARALFEAEAQRDADLADAADKAKEKKEDEQDDYEERLEDLEDFNDEKREEIERDARRAREDAEKEYQRQRDEALRAYARRVQDIMADAQKRATLLRDDFEEQRDIIEEELGIIKDDYQDAYDERVKDLLAFFKSNQNILEALQRGDITIDEIIRQFNITGIPFGGVPFVPEPPAGGGNPPPPPGGQCGPDEIWVDGYGCVPIPTFAGPGDGTNGKTTKVVLELKGDNILRSIMRNTSAEVFQEIIA